MGFEKFCKNCGMRILPNSNICSNCGIKTSFKNINKKSFYFFPIYDVGFFNFNIDFSPYLDYNNEYSKFKICSCGHLIYVDDKFCNYCGKGKEKLYQKYCICGALIDINSNFCEYCGRSISKYASDANFDLKFKDSCICFCGHENSSESFYCESCGLPLVEFNQKFDNFLKLCTCSQLNPLNADFCNKCGKPLNDELIELSCVCGEKNYINLKKCQKCSRELNPKRIVKSKLICKCGRILDYSDSFCPSCGINVRNIK